MTYKQAQQIVARAIRNGGGQAASPDDETTRSNVETNGDSTSDADSQAFDVLSWGSFFDAATLAAKWPSIGAELQANANTGAGSVPFPDLPGTDEVLAVKSAFVMLGG